MEGEEEDRAEGWVDGEEEEKQEVVNHTLDKESEQGGGEIYFHALKGGPNGKIIKVQGQVGKKKLLVLIDSGSTHRFFNEATAMELRCKMIAITPLSMTMANQSMMYSHDKCKGFQWMGMNSKQI